MKVGIDATPLSMPQAGVGTYTANLMRALACGGADEVVPLLYRDVHPSFAEELAGTTLEFRPESRHWQRSTNVWMQTTLRRRIRASRPDLCHFTNSVAPIGLKQPYVVTIHDAGLWLHPEHHLPRRLLLLRPLVGPVARRTAVVITVSQAVKEELVEVLGLPESRIRVIHQGVSPCFHRAPDAGALTRVRQAYRLPERFVLSVGTLEPRKNLVRLLQAHSALYAEPGMRDVGLVIAGPTGWKHQPFLDALANLPPRAPVSLLGAVDRATLVSLYHLATVVAFPSLYEGFELPVVEAMTCGTPVVTSRGGALAEIAGDAAELVDPRLVESIAHGLRQVLADGDHAQRLRERGLQRAGCFTWERAARETRIVYLEALEAAGRKAPVSSDVRLRR